MQNDALQTEILKFCSAFDVVREDQIYAFFRSYARDAVRFRIASLRHDNIISPLVDGYYTAIKGNANSVMNYTELLLAIDILVMLESHEVAVYFAEKYPREITFITRKNEAYDITVFPDAWVTKFSILANQQVPLPEGETDPFVHIAYVPNKEVARKIEPLGFTLFAMPDERGKLSMFSF